MNYKNGFFHLTRLLKDRDSDVKSRFCTLEARFNDNEGEGRLFGQSENIRNERYRIIYELNTFALKDFDISFNELCQQNIVKPTRTVAEILEYFKTASSIGRQGLSREIADQKLLRQEVEQIIGLLEHGEKSILLTDGPATGKSWILLELTERLEENEQWGVLFCKGDRYDDIESERDLIDRLCFPDDLVKLASELAAYRRVVVILDSLDALSLSKNQKALKIFLSLLDRFEAVDGVQIVAACRNFDLAYDPQLRLRKWEKSVPISALDFDTTIAPILEEKWQIDPDQVPSEQKALLTIPGNLKLFEGFAGKAPLESLSSSYHFLNTFLEEVVRKHPALGDQALSALQQMAVTLFDRRSLFMPRESFEGDEAMCRLLQSNGVLQFDSSRNRLGFVHQTLLDTLITKQALADGESLSAFILKYHPFPFIRPSVRTSLFSLRAHTPERFFSQVKQVLEHSNIAYHLKRLIVESLAEIQPNSDDISLCFWLLKEYPVLFRYFLWALNNPGWFDLLKEPLFKPILEASRDDSIRNSVIAKLRDWMDDRPHEVIAFWNKVLCDDVKITNELISSLEQFKHWDMEGIRELLEALLDIEKGQDTLSIGKSLSQYVEATDSGYDLLWSFITAKIDETKSGDEFSSHLHKLRCSDHDFHHKDFLRQRLCISDYLLSLCIKSIEHWSATCYFDPSVTSLRISFLRETSWVYSHHKSDIYDVSPLIELFAHIEYALKERCRTHDTWWQANELKLRETHEAGLAYLLIQAYRVNIEQNISGTIEFLRRTDLFLFKDLHYEVGELLHEAFPFLSDDVQEEFQEKLLNLSSPYVTSANQSDWILQQRYMLLCQIPLILRLPIVQAFIEEWQDSFGVWPQPPEVYSEGGTPYVPVSAEQLLPFSDDAFVTLFRFYDESKIEFRGKNFLEEGTRGVLSEFRICCSLNPTRFLLLIKRLYTEGIYTRYAASILEGVAAHLSYRFGKLQQPQDWKPVEPLPEETSLASELLKSLHEFPDLWKEEYAVSKVLQACCYVVKSPSAVRLLALYLCRFAHHHNPEKDAGNTNDLAFISICGRVAEGAMVLTIRLLEQNKALPELLFPLLPKFAKDPDASVRVSLLYSLPALAYHELEKGWQLFEVIFEEPDARLWSYARRFLYYQYFHHFERVQPYLERMKNEALETAGNVWGIINTLAYLSGYITESQLFDELIALNNKDVWSGVMQVFSANINDSKVGQPCKQGILRASEIETLPLELLSKIDNIFHNLDTDGSNPTIAIAESFIEAFHDVKELCKRVWLFDWIASLSQSCPLAALSLCEKLLDRIEGIDPPCRIFHSDGLVTAYLQIMREADISDDVELIERAVSLQDRFLTLNLYGMWDALDKAGRT